MSSSRRDFLKSFGIGIASIVLAQCTGLENRIDPTDPPDQSIESRIRRYWTSLGNLAAITREDYEQGEQVMGDLLKDHRATLNELIAKEELDTAVADQIQIAFNEAAYHIWRSNAPITCYEPMMVDYTPTSRGQLLQQTALLAELADAGSFDESTIMQARAALERDIAFLSLSNDETQLLYQELIEAAGESYNYPSFDELDLEISSSAIEAAHFLVEVMLEGEGR